MLKTKIYDLKDRLRKGKMLTLVIFMTGIILTLTILSLSLSKKSRELFENSCNQAFYELAEYLNNTEKLLAKATISNDSEHGAIVLTSAWKTASLAQSYLSRIPVETQNLESANKFLNQVGDYCYVLSKKNINGEDLTQEDLNNLEMLHEYSIELKNTINQLEEDLYSGNIRWGALQRKGNKVFKQNNESLEKSSFLSIEEDLHQYTGLIYDGAFSENQNNFKGEGLIGEDITKEEAEEKIKKFINKEKIEEVVYNGESENSKIICYNFFIKNNNNTETTISISKKGGHIVEMNNNRGIGDKGKVEEEAVQKGKEYLDSIGFLNMKETYYMNNNNILTVNYAYVQDEVVVYPDLIKVKVALDNCEILGVETINYLNSHKEKRDIPQEYLPKEKALEFINKNLTVKGSNLAIIPTEYNTELFCWEIKGTINSNSYDREISNDFLVYINAQSGKEEDILLIVDTPNGTLTM